jgi:hypothetical protein
MLLLGQQNQVMTRTATGLESLRQHDVQGLFPITLDHCHTGQRTRNRDVLQAPPTIFSSQHVGLIRVVCYHCENIERPRCLSS